MRLELVAEAGSQALEALPEAAVTLTTLVPHLSSITRAGEDAVVGAKALICGGVPHTSLGIPPLTASGFLPSGIHLATWNQLLERYGTDPNRSKFFPGMLHGLHDLIEAGGTDAYLGGSFVTSSIRPADFDITYHAGQRTRAIFDASPVLKGRFDMKQAYGGEFLPDKLSFLRNKDKLNRRNIGVLKIDLNSLPARSGISPAMEINEALSNPAMKLVLFQH
jgi:hypothetical protein